MDRAGVACAVALLLGSCSSTEHSRERHDLEGRPLTEAFERIGRDTICDDTQPASELGGEFYTPINARFPIHDAASRKVLIREVRWKRGDYFITVFCLREEGEWVVFDVLEWRKDVQF